MDYAKLQAKIYKGYGKSAKYIGTSFDIYRSASMMNPLAPANQIGSLKASFTTSMEYSQYNKPNIPTWTALVDATTLINGDYLTDGNRTFYIAELQPLLPIPTIQCSTIISIARSGYGTEAGGGYGPNGSPTVIAQNLPVFMFNKKDKGGSPHWFPTGTDSTIATPEWQFYINTRTEGDIRAHDVITDALGLKYEVDTPTFSSWGYIVTAKLMEP